MTPEPHDFVDINEQYTQVHKHPTPTHAHLYITTDTHTYTFSPHDIQHQALYTPHHIYVKMHIQKYDRKEKNFKYSDLLVFKEVQLEEKMKLITLSKILLCVLKVWTLELNSLH